MKKEVKMFKEKMKRMRILDFAIVKIGVASFTLFLIGLLPTVRNWVLSIDPSIFLAISLIAAGIVLKRIWKN